MAAKRACSTTRVGPTAKLSGARGWKARMMAELSKGAVWASGLDQRGKAEVEPPRPLEDSPKEESRPLGTGVPNEVLEGFEPLAGLLGIRVR